MSRHLSASMLLASTEPDRLKAFYCQAVEVETDPYDAIAERCAEPRVVLNVDAEDTAAVVAH